MTKAAGSAARADPDAIIQYTNPRRNERVRCASDPTQPSYCSTRWGHSILSLRRLTILLAFPANVVAPKQHAIIVPAALIRDLLSSGIIRYARHLSQFAINGAKTGKTSAGSAWRVILPAIPLPSPVDCKFGTGVVR
jgi:hypothetical protein